MANVNYKEVYLKRAREFETSAATTTEPLVQQLFEQMAEGYWALLSGINPADGEASQTSNPTQSRSRTSRTSQSK